MGKLQMYLIQVGLSVCSSSVDVGRVRWPFEPNLICFRNKEQRKVRVEHRTGVKCTESKSLKKYTYLMGTKRVLWRYHENLLENRTARQQQLHRAYIIIILQTQSFVHIISSFGKMTQSTCYRCLYRLLNNILMATRDIHRVPLHGGLLPPTLSHCLFKKVFLQILSTPRLYTVWLRRFSTFIIKPTVV